MATSIIMPKLGVDMKEGEILEWKKSEGDKVEEGDILLEIMSDKTNMEIEAEESGYLIKIIKQAGESVPVTNIIGYIGSQGEIVVNEELKPKETTEKTSKETIKQTIDETTDKTTDKTTKQESTLRSDLKADEYHIIVIGGGPAGYYAALKASKMGAKVALVEKEGLGGTCLNKGCIPTKTHLKNVEILQNLKIANNRGLIIDSKVKLDINKVVDFKDQVIKTLTGGVKALLNSSGVSVFNGIGFVNQDKSVKVGDKLIRGDKIILATGSKASKINIKGIDSNLVLTSDEALSLREIPKRLAIIGGGVIGVELGQVFNAYGSEVTIIEIFDRLVPTMDKDISIALKKSLQSQGINILTSTELKEIIEDQDSNQNKSKKDNKKDNKTSLTLKFKEGELKSDLALLSIGRVPNLLGLESLNLNMNKNAIKVNEYMETNINGIYAPGDVNGLKMLAHSAFKMGEIAAINAIEGNTKKINLNANPAAIYTSPEVSTIGLTEQEAKEQYGDILVGKFSFSGNGRAIASGDNEGFVKVIADKKYHEIVGVHIVGPNATEMINIASSLISMEITIDEVADIIFSHPSYAESFYEAALDVIGIAPHIPHSKTKI